MTPDSDTSLQDQRDKEEGEWSIDKTKHKIANALIY